MSKKQLGGEESYLNNFVDEVMGSFNMKGGKFQKGGVVELSPMLVSLMTLGMRVAVDPKLSAVLKKHNKLNGGSGELISKAAISNLISGKGSFAGGNIDSSDMFSTDVLPPSTGGRRGGRRGGKLSGGGEAEDLMPSVSPDDEIADAGSLVEGGGKGKKGKKATKAKKGKKTKGGDGGEEIEEFSNLMSGGEADLEEMFSNMQDAMDDPAVGGGKGKKGKKAAKATKAKKGKKTKGGDGGEEIEEFSNLMSGGEAGEAEADLEEMFSNMQDAMDDPSVVGGKGKKGKKAAKATKAAKAKKGKKTKGGDGGEEIEEFSNLMSGGEADLEEMFSNMQDAMDDPAVVGGKGKKGKKAAKAAKAAKATKATKAKKGKKTKGGDGEGSDAELEEMFSNMQDSMDAPVVGGKTRGGKKGGSGIDNIFSFYK
jgi:hypothetical protein